MTTKKIYGPWIKWHGGECPVPPDTMVEVKFSCGVLGREKRAGSYHWNHFDEGGDIVEYSALTEQPDLEAAEKLLRENGYAVTPPTKPLTFEDVVPMTEAPQEGVLYWVIGLSDPEGVMAWRSAGGINEKLFIKRRVAYLDKEHALIAARHIFGLKGGEL